MVIDDEMMGVRHREHLDLYGLLLRSVILRRIGMEMVMAQHSGSSGVHMSATNIIR